MPILRSSPASPFARKARIAALVTGAPVTVVDTDTRAPDPAFYDENPLGKIPVLVLDDGTTVYDSPIILDYLDHLAGGGVLIPTETAARFAALKLQALADGLMDAALLQVYEVRFRPEARRHPEWVSWQAAKVARALDFLEGTPPGPEVDVGTIAVACALGYLDLRFDGRWRQNHPRLVAWLDAFAAAVPAFEATRAV
ncbi:glutathione S-transferase family protein [Segnochrobactrum spirostomi]|uniref:Glutathione S-transferase n=1 Tax=Segnochrobactrum spirostomi TaxID=2608987 RepID=A0A6A7Y2C2_9HYPH|nr:glutathione S-transferase N-terminal domain-containing protein [Segnochrobactrum spirostomi]MQT13200.1 glutathione S-transferase [Segnochrobactrum spirostomi]